MLQEIRSRVLVDDRGQGTVEYVLVILAAAAIALALIGWMSSDGLVSNLFSSILSKVIGFVKG
jgi:Flp pilus assembly pilin Flp